MLWLLFFSLQGTTSMTSSSNSGKASSVPLITSWSFIYSYLQEFYQLKARGWLTSLVMWFYDALIILLHFPCCIIQYVISNIFLFLFDRIIRLHFFNALSINTVFLYGCSRYLLTFFIQNCFEFFFLIVRYRVRSVQDAYCKLFHW